MEVNRNGVAVGSDTRFQPDGNGGAVIADLPGVAGVHGDGSSSSHGHAGRLSQASASGCEIVSPQNE